MSTLASTTSAAFAPPRQRLLNAVASKAETGQIGATDKTALDSAIETIDGSVSGGTGSSKPARLDPSQMKSRIDGLIGDAVSNGTLTDAQASTLKDLFSQGSAKDGGSPPSGSDDGASDDAGTNAPGTDSARTTGTRATDLLAAFVKQLQSSQSQGSAYTAGGSGGGNRIASALLVNFEA